MDPNKIRKMKAFETLFEVDLGVVSAIAADMEVTGYDPAQPIVLGEGPWTDKPVLVDGHMRLAAALEAGLKDVPVITRVFESEEQAILYAVHIQRDRRNLTEIMLLELAERFIAMPGKKELRPAAEDREGQPVMQAPYGRPIEHLSQSLGVSRDQAKKLQAVAKHATVEDKAEIEAGTLTVSGAYERYLQRRWSEEQKEKRWHGKVQGHTRQLIALLQGPLPKELINEETNRLLLALPKLIQHMQDTLPVLNDSEEQKEDLFDSI